MAGDEFLIQLQKARKAVEEYKKERLHEDYPSSGHMDVQYIQQISHHHIMGEKTGAIGAVCPYCGGRSKV
jgi:hypothetical protein